MNEGDTNVSSLRARTGKPNEGLIITSGNEYYVCKPGNTASSGSS